MANRVVNQVAEHLIHPAHVHIHENLLLGRTVIPAHPIELRQCRIKLQAKPLLGAFHVELVFANDRMREVDQ
ncbi:MAG: hypothetical protein ACYCVB_00800 [Bacilli bacterium]